MVNDFDISLESKIYVAGHKGMVGSAVLRKLTALGFKNLIVKSRDELNLVDQHEVTNFFKAEQPEYVLLAAAKVGGIHANNTYPAEFIYQNLMIETNIIHNAWRTNVKRLIFLGSSCIYPKMADQPMREDALLTGPLEATNEPYAVAKIAGIKMCESYNRQYGTDFRSIMPTNLYGENDYFHSQNSHVVPALIKRFHEGKVNKSATIDVWGSGSPKREFLHVDDMAAATLHILNLSQDKFNKSIDPMVSHINIGTGIDCSIKELVEMISHVTDYSGKINWLTDKPEGSPRKLLDVKKMDKLGWQAEISLLDGLKKTYLWFLENQHNYRE